MAHLTREAARHRGVYIILAIILVVGGWLRFYELNAAMHVGADEIEYLSDMAALAKGENVLIGPPLRGPYLGSYEFRLGPAWYYILLPSYLLSGGDPIGPALTMAAIGTLTIIFIYWATTLIAGRMAGLIAASLYAISLPLIYYDRSFWVANPIPTVTAVFLIFLGYYYRTRRAVFLYLLAITVGVGAQLHPIIFILVILMMLLHLTRLLAIPRRQALIGLSLIFTITIPSIVAVVNSPSAGQTDWLAIFSYFLGSPEAYSKIQSFRQGFVNNFSGGLFASENVYVTMTLLIALGGWLWYRLRQRANRLFVVIAIWLSVVLGLLLLYRGPHYTHYFLVVVPPFLVLMGDAVAAVVKKFKVLGVGMLLAILSLALLQDARYFIDAKRFDVTNSYPAVNLGSLITLGERRAVIAAIISHSPADDVQLRVEPAYEKVTYSYLLELQGAAVDTGGEVYLIVENDNHPAAVGEEVAVIGTVHVYHLQSP